MVPLAAILMAIILIVAIFTVHLRFGFTSIKLLAVTAAGPHLGPSGYETNLLYLACLAPPRWPLLNRRSAQKPIVAAILTTMIGKPPVLASVKPPRNS